MSGTERGRFTPETARRAAQRSADVRRLRAEERAARRWEVRRRFEPWPTNDRGSSERAADLKGEAQRLLVDAAPLAVETLIGIMVTLTSASFVLATIQGNVAGTWVRGVTVSVGNPGSLTI